MSAETKKVGDVLLVLSIMRKRFIGHMGAADVAHLRKESVNSVANSLLHSRFKGNEISAERTISDALGRRLKPEIAGLGAFDKLSELWLRNGSTELKNILLKHANGPVRRDEVIAFFDDERQKNSPPAPRTSATSKVATFAFIWLPGTAADQNDSTYTPQEGDHRRIIERQIRERRGQQAFRDGLRKWYQDSCLISRCRVLDVLEAAHIKPYRGANDNDLGNGLLLRSDIHTLFDLDLLGIEPNGLCVQLHPDLSIDEEYAKLAGTTLNCPNGRRPSLEALRLRYKQFQERHRRRK